jgi:hypothetical protein
MYVPFNEDTEICIEMVIEDEAGTCAFGYIVIYIIPRFYHLGFFHQASFVFSPGVPVLGRRDAWTYMKPIQVIVPPSPRSFFGMNERKFPNFKSVLFGSHYIASIGSHSENNTNCIATIEYLRAAQRFHGHSLPIALI